MRGLPIEESWVLSESCVWLQEKLRPGRKGREEEGLQEGCDIH
jgi:hypothetical protein